MGKNKLLEEAKQIWSKEFDNIDYIDFFKKFNSEFQESEFNKSEFNKSEFNEIKFYPYLIGLLKKEIESTDYTKDDLYYALDLMRKYLNIIIKTHYDYLNIDKTTYKDPSFKVVTDIKKIKKIQKYGEKYRKYYNNPKNKKNIDKMIDLLQSLSNNIVKRMNEIFLKKKEEEEKEKEEKRVEKEGVEVGEEEEEGVEEKNMTIKNVVVEPPLPLSGNRILQLGSTRSPSSSTRSPSSSTTSPVSSKKLYNTKSGSLTRLGEDLGLEFVDDTESYVPDEFATQYNSGGKRLTIKRKRSNTKRSNTKRSNTKRINRKTKRSNTKRRNTKT